jgi:hypothetical protein
MILLAPTTSAFLQGHTLGYQMNMLVLEPSRNQFRGLSTTEGKNAMCCNSKGKAEGWISISLLTWEFVPGIGEVKWIRISVL